MKIRCIDSTDLRACVDDEARRRPPVIEELEETSGFDVWDLARKSGEWLPGVDAVYGSSVFLPMEDAAAFEVSMTRTGLIARRITVYRNSDGCLRDHRNGPGCARVPDSYADRRVEPGGDPVHLRGFPAVPDP